MRKVPNLSRLSQLEQELQNQNAEQEKGIIQLEIGHIHFHKSEFGTAISYAKKCAEVAREHLNLNLLFDARLLEATVLSRTKNYKKPLEILLSIENLCNKVSSESRLEWYLLMSRCVRSKGDAEQTWKYLNAGQKEAESINSDYWLAQFIRESAFQYLNSGEYKLALPIVQKAFEHAEKSGDLVLQMESISTIGHVHYSIGNFEKAISYQLEGLRLAEISNSPDRIATCNVNLGNMYAVQGDYSEAAKRLNKGIHIFRSRKNHKALFKALNNLSTIQAMLGDLHLALETSKSAEVIALDLNDNFSIKISHLSKGSILLKMERYEEALAELVLARDIKGEQQDHYDASTFIYLATCLFRLGNVKEAKIELEKAKEKKSITHDVEIYELSYLISKKEDDIPSAIKNLKDWQDCIARISGTKAANSLRKTERKYIRQLEEDNHVILKEQNDQIEKSNIALRQFAIQLENDLKTPLNNIIEAASSYQNKQKESPSDNHDLFLDQILATTKAADKLLSDLLNFALAVEKDNKFEIVSLNEVVEQAAINLKVVFEEKEAQLIYDNLPTVVGNKTKFIQLFQNIISNAVKFQAPGNIPIIEIDQIHHLQEVIVKIKDNGIGIDPQYQAQIFNAFNRLHSTEEYPGSGLGLAIAEKIVRNLSCTLKLDSEPGKGSTISITIPLSLPLSEKDSIN